MNKLNKTRSSVLVSMLVLSLASSIAHARSIDLVEPGTVTLNCSLSADKMKEGIMRGGSARHWTVVNQSPGNTELKFIKGQDKHIIMVNVSYTSNTFAVTYKDSVNLNYSAKDDGTRRIHPRPVGWMSNLSGDIQMAANNLCHG